MDGKLLNGASPAVNAAASAKPVDVVAARAAAGAAITAATGLPALDAVRAVDACMASLQRSGLITVGSVELAMVGQRVEAMTFALAQAYVLIDEKTSGPGPWFDEAGALAMLTLIEGVLGAKPQRVADPPRADA